MARTPRNTGAQSGSPQPVPSTATPGEPTQPVRIRRKHKPQVNLTGSGDAPAPAPSPEGAPHLLEIPALFTGEGKSEADIVAEGETLVTRLLGQGDDSPLMEQFACGPYFMHLKDKAKSEPGAEAGKGSAYNAGLKKVLTEAKVTPLGTTFKHVTWMLADARRWSMLQHLLSRMTEKERARFRTTATAYKKVMTELKSPKLKEAEAKKKAAADAAKNLALKESGEYLLADDEELEGFIDANRWNELTEAQYTAKKAALDKWHQRMNQ